MTAMTPRRDELAVLRFAIQSRDWRLVELLARVLGRDTSSWLGVAHHAYLTLSGRLGFSDRLQ